MIKREFEGKKLLLVDDLSPEDVAMVQALYARRAESAEGHIQQIYDGRREAIRETLSKELFIEEAIFENLSTEAQQDLVDAIFDATSGEHASTRAGRFMASYLVGYGHKSIGDCGTFTVFVEGVSILAAKAFQDWPLYSGQETSTRAIDFSNSADENEDKVIGRLVDPIGSEASRSILNRWMVFYRRSQTRVTDEVRRRYPRGSAEGQEQYEGAVKARVFDIMRGFLPAGVTTQFSWHTNIRQAGDHLIGLLRHPLAEVREIAAVLVQMLQGRYPSSGASFGELPSLSGIGDRTERFGDKEKRWVWEARIAGQFSYPSDIDAGPEWAHTKRFLSTVSREGIARYRDAILDGRPRGCVLPHFLSDLGQLTFSFELDFGSYRDIQRHRNGAGRMPVLTTDFGFEGWYLDQLDDASRQEAVELLTVQTDAIDALDAESTERQNYIALGFKVPVTVTHGLPAAVYVMELRSGKTVHPTLRRAIHNNMIKPFRREFPEVVLHVDMDPDDWTIRRGSQNITAR
jgi:thymidylate synthase ThyX